MKTLAGLLGSVALLLLGVAVTAGDEPARVKVEFRLAQKEPGTGLVEAKIAGTDEKLYLQKEALLTNKDIAEARVGTGPDGKPAVELEFAKGSREKVGKLTEQHLNKMVAILVDGKILSAPLIRAKFSERATITGTFTKGEANRIVRGLGGK